MKQLTVTELKRRKLRARVRQIPRDGSQLRALYDLFQANKGVTVKASTTRGSGNFSSLTDYYGMDIRHMGYGQWMLVGEWFGKVYVDYLAERLKKEAAERAVHVTAGA